MYVPGRIDASSAIARSPQTDGGHFSLTPLGDVEALGAEWRRLEAQSATPFFLSWDWIGCWLKSMPTSVRPNVLRLQDAGRLIGLALLGASAGRRLRIIPCRRLHLHEIGEAALDSLTIEYNGILTAPERAPEVTRRAVEWLLDNGLADEVELPGVPPSVVQALDGRRFATRLRDHKPVYRIELAPGEDRGAFLDGISANTRSQLRRAMRQFAAIGQLGITAARDTGEAQDMLSELVVLHQAYWRRRNRAGAFAQSAPLAFHRRLIEDGFASGCVQLFRCTAGQSILGYLYNFQRAGHIYAYQSGFNYELLPRAKPGWVCHYLAIEENRRQGAVIYDLLAGHSQFKASFARPAGDLVWATVEPAGWHASLMGSLRAAKARATTAMQQRGKAAR